MNIDFVLDVRYPTNKAYGVTTEFTARAARDLGHKVTLVTINKDVNITSNLDVREIKGFIDFKNSKISKLIFKVRLLYLFNQLIFALKIAFSRDITDIFWLRSPTLGTVLTIFGKKIIFEIHIIKSRKLFLLIKLLSLMPNVILAPCSELLGNNLGIRKYKYVIAPMGVREDEILEYRAKEISQKIFNVGYLGRLESSGEHLNIEHLINAISKVNSLNYPICFKIIGISRDQLEKHLGRTVQLKDTSFLPNIGREEVILAIDTFDLGLVIYPEPRKIIENLHAFPIKIVEYAARGIPILISATRTHCSILDVKNALFYTPEDSEDLSKKITDAYLNQSKLEDFRKRNLEWVKDYTYTKRVENVLNRVSKRFIL